MNLHHRAGLLLGLCIFIPESITRPFSFASAPDEGEFSENNAMRFAVTALHFGLWALLSCGCGSDVVHTSTPPSSLDQGQGEEGEVFITDHTGKAWDVTHAVGKYGMEPSMFGNGLGPFAIKPIVNARMLSPGDLNYPLDSQGMLVIGTSLNGFTRAYPIEILSRFEVANERFGEAHVAVAW